MRASPLSAAVTLDLSPSPAMALLLGAVYLGAGGVVLSLPLPAWGMVVLIAVLGLSGVRELRRHALLRGAGAVIRVTLDADGGCWLGLADGTHREALLLPDSYVHHHLLVLRFAVGWRRHAVVVAPGMAHPEQRRRLTARLRLDGVSSGRSRAPH